MYSIHLKHLLEGCSGIDIRIVYMYTDQCSSTHLEYKSNILSSTWYFLIGNNAISAKDTRWCPTRTLGIVFYCLTSILC